MIISVFNFTWFIVMFVAIVYLVFTINKYSKKTDDEKISFMLKQSIILCVLWVVYKVLLSMDPEYTDLFEFWNELPLQPCNTVCWLSIIACVKKNKSIMAYSFYAGVLFAMLAMIMPPEGFYDVSVFKFRCIGFYGSHWMVIIIGIQFAAFKLFDINNKSAFKAIGCYFVISAILHVINIIMRATVFPKASYYYTFGRESNAILTMMHDLIPVNFVYLFPFMVAGLVLFIAESYAINATGRLIRKSKDRS